MDTKEKNPEKSANKAEQNLIKRRRLTQGFLSSEFFIHYLKPELEKEIESNNKISSLDINKSDTELAKDIRMKKYKKDIYKGLINKLKMWAEKSYAGGK